jgi:anti-sigma regulatory factor (Ser/Thr protein kinase)
VQATIDRYGAWDVDEADPVRIELREVVTNQQQQVEMVITDQGNGIPDKISGNMYHYFWSSHQPKLTL